MNQFISTYNALIQENQNILINETYIFNELKVKCIMEGQQVSDEILQESARIAYELYQEGWPNMVIEEGWKSALGHTVAYIAGAIDPTGVVDIAHAVQLFITGHWIVGSITLLGVIPYIGDTAKLLIPSVTRGKPLVGVAARVAQKILNMGGNLNKLLAKPVNLLLRNKQFSSWAAKNGMRSGVQIAQKITSSLMTKLKALLPSKIMKFGGNLRHGGGKPVMALKNLRTVKNAGQAAKRSVWKSASLGSLAGFGSPTKETPIETDIGDYNFSGL